MNIETTDKVQAFAYVVTADYKYWNPIPDTVADDEAGARRLAADYAARTWPDDSVAWRRDRLLRELRVMPHRTGRAS